MPARDYSRVAYATIGVAVLAFDLLCIACAVGYPSIATIAWAAGWFSLGFLFLCAAALPTSER